MHRLVSRVLALAAGFGLAALLMTYARADNPTSPQDAAYGANAARYPLESIKSCRISVAATATALKCTITGWSNPRVRVVKNCGSQVFDLGDSTVATGAGDPLEIGERVNANPAFSGTLGTALTVYGIVSSGTSTACISEYK